MFAVFLADVHFQQSQKQCESHRHVDWKEIWWSSNANSCSKCCYHQCWRTLARVVSHRVLKTSGHGDATTTLCKLFPLNKVCFLNTHLEIHKLQPVAFGFCYCLPLTEESGFLVFTTTLQVTEGYCLITTSMSFSPDYTSPPPQSLFINCEP